MTKQLWAPWRLAYISSADEQSVLLNKFPYASGHLMLAPLRHVGDFAELTDEEALELHRLAGQGMGALAQLYEPQGYNVGWNLGRIAGAGVVDHVHVHDVPRWAGDANFLPVVGQTKALPQLLDQTWEIVRNCWDSYVASGDC